MKILSILDDQISPPSGDGATRFRAFLEALAWREHELHVASCDVLSAELSFPVRSRRHLRQSPPGRGPLGRLLATHSENVRRCLSFARSIGPDLIVAHNTISGVIGLVTKRAVPSASLVLDLTALKFGDATGDGGTRRASLWKSLAGKLEGQAIRGADRIVTVSSAMRRVLKEFGVEESKIEVIPDGVDGDRFRPGRSSELRESLSPWADQIVVLHGEGRVEGDSLLLVDAAKEVVKRYPRTAFWVLGGGAEFAKMRRRVVRQGVSKHFHFTGWLPINLIPRYVASADIGLVLIPDRRSCLGRTTSMGFECWASGLPVIHPDLPGLSEMTARSRAGCVYTSGDSESLSKQILSLIDSPQLRREMGGEGRRMVEHRFNWQRLGRQMARNLESGFMEREYAIAAGGPDPFASDARHSRPRGPSILDSSGAEETTTF